MAGQGVAKTRGSQRDDYQHRMDAQYKRLWRATAIRAKQLCEAAKLQTVFLVGSERMTIPIEAEFPKQLRERVIRINEDFGGLSLPELQHRLAPSITKWEAEHETALVANLLAEDRKAVVGLDKNPHPASEGQDEDGCSGTHDERTPSRVHRMRLDGPFSGSGVSELRKGAASGRAVGHTASSSAQQAHSNRSSQR